MKTPKSEIRDWLQRLGSSLIIPRIASWCCGMRQGKLLDSSWQKYRGWAGHSLLFLPAQWTICRKYHRKIYLKHEFPFWKSLSMFPRATALCFIHLSVFNLMLMNSKYGFIHYSTLIHSFILLFELLYLRFTNRPQANDATLWYFITHSRRHNLYFCLSNLSESFLLATVGAQVGTGFNLTFVAWVNHGCTGASRTHNVTYTGNVGVHYATSLAMGQDLIED